MEKKKLQARQLQFNDVYAAAKILKNITVEIDEKELDKIKNDGVKAGINVLKNMIADSGKAKREINDFLGGIFGISGKEFGELGMADSIDCFRQLKNLEGVSDFLSAVGQLTE